MKKPNQMTWTPSEDSDQPEHQPSLISLCCALYGWLRIQTVFRQTAKTLDQTGWMTKLGAPVILLVLSFCGSIYFLECLFQVFHDFPKTSANIPLSYFFDLIPVLQPRAFSIASSLKVRVVPLFIIIKYKVKI